tara:strand:+ start:326 stop:469 length:144 start_codon:yes stop_codon:yes gene_type:complete
MLKLATPKQSSDNICCTGVNLPTLGETTVYITFILVLAPADESSFFN